MTPERLAQIELAARYRAGSYDEIRYGALELLNEVERLQDLRRRRDAAVAAEALRDAANEVYGDERAAGQHWHPLSLASWLRDRADRLD